jgi:hypothetical protein
MKDKERKKRLEKRKFKPNIILPSSSLKLYANTQAKVGLDLTAHRPAEAGV